MVLNTDDDPLYTPAEMHRADAMLRETFEKGGCPGRYRCSFYPGPHKFDLPMQKDAFDWLDARLKS